MRKRLFAALVCAVLVLSLFPVTAAADGASATFILDEHIEKLIVHIEGNYSYELIVTSDTTVSYDSETWLRITVICKEGFYNTSIMVTDNYSSGPVAPRLMDGMYSIALGSLARTLNVSASDSVVVSQLRLNGYSAPVAGESADGWAPLTFGGDIPYTVSPTLWIAENDSDETPVSVFEAGKAYYCKVTLTAKTGCSFAENPSFIVDAYATKVNKRRCIRVSDTVYIIRTQPEYAVSILSEIRVDGYRSPVAGEYALDWLTLTIPENALYTVSCDWFDMTDGEVNKTYSPFAEDHIYACRITVLMNSGASIDEATKVFVNGGTALVDPENSSISKYTGYIRYFIYVLPQKVLTPVHTADVSVPAPVVGETPAAASAALTLPENAGFSVEHVDWFDTEAPETPVTGVFEEFKSYFAVLTLKEAEGYCWYAPVAGTVNDSGEQAAADSAVLDGSLFSYRTAGFAAVGHTYENHEAKSATCTEADWEAYRTCGRCDYTEFEEIAPLGHSYEKGYCAVCGTEDPDWDFCAGYTDINRKLWYHSAVDYVIKNGLMGSTKTAVLTFEPNTKVSRAMVCSILYRFAGSPAEVEYTAAFADVAEGKWFAAAVEWAAQNGLASGKGNGKFDPNGNVTRQELAVFMKKMAEYLGRDVSGSAELSVFGDAGSVPVWAAPYVQWAVDAGLISGKSAGGVTVLAPKDNATRAELASIITRFMQSAATPE